MTEQLNFGTAADPAGDAAKATHIAAMIAKADETAAAAQAAASPTAGTTQTPAADELIAGKFKTQDDLIAAYKSLEAKLGAPKDPVTPPVEPVKDPLKIEPATPEAAVADAGFKMEDLSAEYAANGDLKPETYEKLAKGGISKEMVSAHIAGQQALAAQTRNAVFTAVGIKDDAAYGEIAKWAQANLTAEELTAYNTGVSGSKAQMQMAVEALYGRFTRANGSAPNLLTGQAGRAGGDAYQSQAQWLAEVKDPRYAKDPAFRNAVMQKLRRSNI